MDRKTIFTITLSGEGEIKSHTSHLSGDIKRALMLVDDKSTVAELSKRAAPSLRSSLDEMLQELLDGGFIQDKSRKDNAPRIVAPRIVTPRIVTPVTRGEEEGEDLDFTLVMRPPTAEFLAAETARVKAQAEAQAQAERVRVTAEIAEMKARAAAQAKQDAQFKQEAKARQDAEVERIRKEQEEAIARVRAEVETRAKQEADAARFKAEQETAKANADAEAARAEMEQVRAKLAEAKTAEEVKARADALAQQAAKQEAEAARVRAEQEAETVHASAEAARIKAEQATARANADAEAARAEMEQVRAKLAEAKTAEEVKARADALAQQAAKQEAEAARVRAEQEAETVRASAEAARIKAEQDMAQAKAEVGEARMEAQNARTELAQNRARAQAEEKSRAVVIDQAVAQPTSYEFQLDSLLLTGFEKAPLEAAPTAPPRIGVMHAGEGVSEPKGQQKQAEIEARERAAELKSRHEADVAQAKAVQDTAQLRVDARQMADEQARVWAEAEQRAQALAATQALADAKAELTAQQASRHAQEKTTSARRQPVPWGKMATGLLVVLLILAAILPYVLPMQDYVVQMEKKLTAQLHQPVHIAKMKAVLLPLPKLELQQVEIGSSQELKATSVVLNFNLSVLFAEIRAINSVEINDLVLKEESFAQTLAVLRSAGGDVHYPVARMTLHRARFEGAGLPTMNGSADWNEQRHLDKVVLTSEDGKLNMKLQSQNAHWQIALNVKEGSLPILPALTLHELSATGEVTESAANFNEISGGLYGGMLSGNAQLNWQHGWQMQGRVTVKMLELHDLFPQFGIAGEMAGDSAFLLRGATLAQLSNTTHLDGSVVLKKGVISKIDIVRTASDASHRGAAGGRTNFDELNAMLKLEKNTLSLSQIRLYAGVMSATGAAEVGSGNALSGRLNVDLKMRAGLGSIPLVLSGTPKEPVLRVAR